MALAMRNRPALHSEAAGYMVPSKTAIRDLAEQPKNVNQRSQFEGNVQRWVDAGPD